MEEKRIGTSLDLLIHPGETIADVLAERGITQNELAAKTGATPAYIGSVISGNSDITSELAAALDAVLGVPKSFWMNLQANYDEEKAELGLLSKAT